MTLSSILALALLPVALFWLLPLLSEALTLAGAIARTGATGASGRPSIERERKHAARVKLAFLVPAHDEELLIRDCVDSLWGQDAVRADIEVFVIADNCSDRTARIAQQAGARVLERFDPGRPGKPAAIEWALGRIPLSTFEAVVIIDADSVVHAGFADALAARTPLGEKAVQAYNGSSNEGASWLSRLGGLLGRMRYEGQYPVKRKAGLNCPLTGNGMCLGTGLLRRAGWAPDSLTENWELYARYTARGEVIDFAPDAWVGAREAPTLAHSAPQRRRWQAGRRGVLKEFGWRIVTSRKIGWNQKLDLLAELSIPGPMLHATLAAGLAALLLVADTPGVLAKAVSFLFLLSLLPTVAWTLVAWARHPEPARVAVAFAGLPVYGFWRVGVGLLAFATGRRRVWLRSPRPASAVASPESGEEAPAA